MLLLLLLYFRNVFLSIFFRCVSTKSSLFYFCCSLCHCCCWWWWWCLCYVVLFAFKIWCDNIILSILAGWLTGWLVRSWILHTRLMVWSFFDGWCFLFRCLLARLQKKWHGFAHAFRSTKKSRRSLCVHVERGKPFKNGSSSVITIILTTLTEIAIQSVIKSFHKFTSHFHKLCVILNLIQTNLSSDACWIYYIHIWNCLCDLRLQWQKAPLFLSLSIVLLVDELAWFDWQTQLTNNTRECY